MIPRKIINYQTWHDPANKRHRSFRSNSQETSDKLVKRVVLRGISLLLVIYLIYLLFFSHYFSLSNIQITVKTPDFNTNELNDYLKTALNKKFLFIFPRDNYFLFSKNYLEKQLNEKYIIEDLIINKIFPKTLTVSLREKVTNLLYQTADKIYLIDLNGRILAEVGERIIINEKGLIKIVDESNTTVAINQNILMPNLITLITNLNQKFNEYFPNLSIAFYKITDPQSTFIKLVTTTGLEIHLNDRLGLEEQLTKLKRSLESGMVDLTKIQYINLRIKDQVIYK